MKKRVLLVSSANPHPAVTNGCQRLVLDYEQTVFSGYDVYFLAAQPGTWAPGTLFHNGVALGSSSLEQLLACDFEFAFFVGFKHTEWTGRITANVPAFCLSDTFPHTDVPDGLFRGVLAHCTSIQRDDVLLCGGSYDSDVFYKMRQGEDFVLCVGRLHPDKNQLELAAQYRRRIYDRYGLPLYLVGGVDDADYSGRIRKHIDDVAVRSTIDSQSQDAPDNWRSAREIAHLCNHARFFVSASSKESFGIALVEALACGTTCVVNGEFRGFRPEDLGPNVFGNVAGRQGSILDVLERAFAADVRIDGSEWVKKYSLRRAAIEQIAFIEHCLSTLGHAAAHQ